MFEAETRDLCGQSRRAVSGAVVRVETLDANSEFGKEGESGVEEGDSTASGFVGKDSGEGQTGVIVDGDVEVFPAGAAGMIMLTVTRDAMTWANNPGQFLDIEMQQVPRMSTLVADDGRGMLQGTETMKAMATQKAADGGFGELGFGSDLKARQLAAA